MELMKGSLASLLYGDQSHTTSGSQIPMTDKRYVPGTPYQQTSLGVFCLSWCNLTWSVRGRVRAG